MPDYGVALRHVAKAVSGLREAVTPDQYSFVRIQLAETLERAGAHGEAAEVRADLLRATPAIVERAFEAIRRHSPHAPQYQVDEYRLACEQALLCFGSAIAGLARYHIHEGSPEAARRAYLAGIDYLAGIAGTAEEIDGRRRTFEAVTGAYSTLHCDLGAILAEAGEVGGAVFHTEEALRASRGAYPDSWHRLGELVARHGGEAIREAADTYFGSTIGATELPITRWRLIENAKRWLEAVDAVSGPRPEGRRILMLALNLHHIQFCLAVTCVLLARGHRVDFVWLPTMRHQRECDPEPDYGNWDEAFMAADLERLGRLEIFERLELFDLRSFPLAERREDMEIECRRLSRIDTANMLGRSLDPEAEDMRSFEANRYDLDIDALRRLESYFDARPCDLALILNGGVMEYGAAYWEARRRNIRVITFEASTQQKGRCVLSADRRYGEHDMQAIWRADEPHAATPERQTRLLSWLRPRGAADLATLKPRGRVTVSAEAERDLLAGMGLDPDKPVAALFPNITWDTAVIGRDTIFRSMEDWALASIEFFQSRPDLQLVVRAHPQEKVSSWEFIGKLVRERWPDLPANVALVESEDPLSTYRLLGATQAALVYTGTLGIECAVFGLHVLCAGRAHYIDCGFTRNPESRDAYFDLAARIMLDPESVALTRRQIEKAWCYADLYMNQVPLPFPWAYDDFLSSVENEWPMDRVLSADGEALFGRTFEYFAGDREHEPGLVGFVSEVG